MFTIDDINWTHLDHLFFIFPPEINIDQLVTWSRPDFEYNIRCPPLVILVVVRHKHTRALLEVHAGGFALHRMEANM